MKKSIVKCPHRFLRHASVPTWFYDYTPKFIRLAGVTYYEHDTNSYRNSLNLLYSTIDLHKGLFKHLAASYTTAELGTEEECSTKFSMKTVGLLWRWCESLI